MTQLLSDGAPRPLPRVLTVADLLTRNVPPVPRTAGGERLATVPVSVGALLRREGRAPHSLDRPVRPRSSQQEAAAPEVEPWVRSVVVRRAAVAAGTLLAAGSVFGATVVNEPAGSSQAPDGGEGAATDRGGTGQPGTEPAGGAAAGALDPGGAAPMTWFPVAFPGPGGELTSADGGVPLAGPGASAAAAPVLAAPAGPVLPDPLAPSPVPAGTVPSTAIPPGPAAPGTGPADPVPPAPLPADRAAPADPAPAGPGPLRSAVAPLTEPVEQLTGDVGAVAPEPLRVSLTSLGDTAGDTGEAVGDTLDAAPGALAAAPVETVTEVVEPVTEVVEPVTEVVEPVTEVVEPVTAPVTSLLGAGDEEGPSTGGEVREPALSTLTGGAATGGPALTESLGRTAADLLG